ncbi:MAG: hypothetical protein M3Z54_10780 [Gemmatimonadota bacterium]|nr:hypothetical protein [Gemmatimonadota bacterium]
MSLRPLITSVFPFSKITPGGGVIVQGENFAAPDGSFGKFELILCPIPSKPCNYFSGTRVTLENMQWGDTFAAGTLPTNWVGLTDVSAKLSITRSDGPSSDLIPVEFIATRDFAVLPSSDVQADCSQGADDNNCQLPRRDWGDFSATGAHRTSYGNDMGVDRFTATLQNGWVFYDMDFTTLSTFYGDVKPPGGFNGMANSVELSVYFEQDGGGFVGGGHTAHTAYGINLYIMGPKGTKWTP